ncbi:hypothetical protein [Holospora undulata]|uniref:Uncharacterized protein n=2 Tax=Holospora TaxID=44747 RepID=A0A061JH92_9PROT|nr:hypothetical protein [Holospora undulata]ETZ05525.1 hypothetical protein K737_300035 [Holospora undulata HU1]
MRVGCHGQWGCLTGDFRFHGGGHAITKHPAVLSSPLNKGASYLAAFSGHAAGFLNEKL